MLAKKILLMITLPILSLQAQERSHEYEYLEGQYEGEGCEVKIQLSPDKDLRITIETEDGDSEDGYLYPFSKNFKDRGLLGQQTLSQNLGNPNGLTIVSETTSLKLKDGQPFSAKIKSRDFNLFIIPNPLTWESVSCRKLERVN